MEKTLNSVLKFNKYIVKSVEYNTNFNFHGNDEIELEFDFNSSTKIVDNVLEVELEAVIFKEASKNNYPFEMAVTVTGIFEVENENPENFKGNAIAILFPYVRSLVSTYSANANVAPVILPIININAYLKLKENI